jgi:glyoxylase-like metal-dependent hydrolase (beta-lactamase superfamily II)
LLVEDGNRLILIDNGNGDKQSDNFFKYYYLNGDDNLEKSLNKYGFTTDDITDMFLSHLHFDHCGGSIKWNSDRTGYKTTFKNATYWSNERHWEWATKPNAREKASFLKENIMPIKESGQLKLTNDGEEIYPGFKVMYANGHTDAMMLPHINVNGRTIVYVADLIPSTAHIPVPFVMGYDTRPLISMVEKEAFLNRAAENDYILFFEHDPFNECCTLQKTDKGVRVKETFLLENLVN